MHAGCNHSAILHTALALMFKELQMLQHNYLRAKVQ